MTKVSVIIATYNNSELISRSIKSILAQNFPSLEIIVVDDGSTDNTRSILSSFLDSEKIKYFYQSNAGPGSARDHGIEKSKGEYIAILDSDDYWSDPNKLKKQVDFLDNNSEFILVGGGVIAIDRKNNEILRKLFPEQDKDIRNSILVKNIFVHSTVLYRKKSWEEVGGYGNKSLQFSEDWNLWLKLGKIGKFYNFQEYFTYYLISESNKYNNKSILMNLELQKKYRKDYPNFYQSFLLGWLQFFYKSLPFRNSLRALFHKMKVI